MSLESINLMPERQEPEREPAGAGGAGFAVYRGGDRGGAAGRGAPEP